MDLLSNPTIGFLLIMLASLFLFGELLVKGKGLFGIVGIGLMTFYFSFHLSELSAIWTAALFVMGIVLLIVDGKLTNDGTLAVIGIILMVAAVALPSPSLVYGMMAGAGLIIGGASSLLLLKALPARDLWGKVALTERLTSQHGYNSLNNSYEALVGKSGITETPFRPVGTVTIEGKSYSAITNGSWLDPHVSIKVLAVDGTRIVVEKTDSAEEQTSSIQT